MDDGWWDLIPYNNVSICVKFFVNGSIFYRWLQHVGIGENNNLRIQCEHTAIYTTLLRAVQILFLRGVKLMADIPILVPVGGLVPSSGRTKVAFGQASSCVGGITNGTTPCLSRVVTT
jgi:hypothetical protein